MTDYLGYVAIQHDDSPLTAYTVAFKQYTHPFTISCVPGFTSYKNQFSFRDKISGIVYYWKTLWAGQMNNMINSGRVSLQNHTMSHLRLSELATPEDADSLLELERECLSARDWIGDFQGATPIYFTPPYVQYHAWQAAYFDVWFRYWLYLLPSFDADTIANLNSFPLPIRLKGHYLGAIAGTPAVSAASWAYVDAMLTHLKTNKKLCIILMHDITTENTATVGRNILPSDYAILMQKLAPILENEHLIKLDHLI